MQLLFSFALSVFIVSSCAQPVPDCVYGAPNAETFAAQVNASYFRLAEEMTTMTLEPISGASPTNVIIVLHGLGSNATSSVVPLVKVLQATALPTTRFLIPQAPPRYVTSRNVTIPSWFDILTADPVAPEPLSKEQVVYASSVISHLAETQVTHTIPRSKIGILGTSQGGILGITSYLRYQYGAMAGLVTALGLRSSYPRELRPGFIPPMIMLHGTNDSVIPIQAARLSRDLLQSYGVNVTLTEFEGEKHRFAKNSTLMVTQVILATYFNTMLN